MNLKICVLKWIRAKIEPRTKINIRKPHKYGISDVFIVIPTQLLQAVLMLYRTPIYLRV